MLLLLTTVASHCVERQDNDVILLILRAARELSLGSFTFAQRITQRFVVYL